VPTYHANGQQALLVYAAPRRLLLYARHPALGDIPTYAKDTDFVYELHTVKKKYANYNRR
jgi:hypothetical protein